jgi:hypothetical protein
MLRSRLRFPESLKLRMRFRLRYRYGSWRATVKRIAARGFWTPASRSSAVLTVRYRTPYIRHNGCFAQQRCTAHGAALNFGTRVPEPLENSFFTNHGHE